METLQDNLRILGLTEEEIIIYITILDTGAESILHISQKTNIPRTTVYLLIDSLLQKKLLHEMAEGKKKKYIPASPEEIVKYAQNKKQQLVQTIDQLQKDIPQMRALYNLRYEKPKMKYFEGLNQVKKMLENSLDGEEIYFHFMSPQGRELIGDELESYFEELLNKMIFTKQIIVDTPNNRDFQKKYATERNKILCLDKKYQTSVDFVIFNETIVHIVYKNDTPMAVVIEDKEIAHFEKIRFNLLWEQSTHEDV